MQQLPLFEGAYVDFGLVGDSPEIQRVRRFIYKLTNNRCPVLLLGESGTGKELVARALHAVAPGANGVLLPVNAAALSPTLIESELFGHARGSFTGAASARRGLFEQADGGTLFLDEIGELPAELQAKLLRVLEEGSVRPLGAKQAVAVDVRVIAATNRDLAVEIEQGRFRADLYYRLNVVSIHLPPLRERRDDILLLIEHFLEKYAPRPLQLDHSVLQCFLTYDWPGNVRQLENCIQRIAALASGVDVSLDDLPTQIRNAVEACDLLVPRGVMPLAEVERLAIERAMTAASGNYARAARILRIGKATLYRKLKKYGRKPKTRAAGVP